MNAKSDRLAIFLKNEIRDRFSTITGFIVITYLETSANPHLFRGGGVRLTIGSKNDQKVRSVKDEV